MLLSRPQMMLNALKLQGERRQRGKRSHHYSKTHHFLVARHRHFRFRLEVTRTNAHVMSRPLSRCSATASQLRIPSWSNHTVLDTWKKGRATPALSADRKESFRFALLLRSVGLLPPPFVAKEGLERKNQKENICRLGKRIKA